MLDVEYVKVLLHGIVKLIVLGYWNIIIKIRLFCSLMSIIRGKGGGRCTDN